MYQNYTITKLDGYDIQGKSALNYTLSHTIKNEVFFLIFEIHENHI